MIGKLYSDLKYSTGFATFKPWASTTPENESVAEDETTDAEEVNVFNWAFLQTGEQLNSGSSVTVIWAAGRWYLIDGPCPVAEV